MTDSPAGSRSSPDDHVGTNASSPREDLDVLVFYVPVDDTDRVLAAVFAAGAGAIGDYRDCAFVAAGTGQFRPIGAAHPTIGRVGDLEHVAEHRVELVLPRRLRSPVVAALRRAHPYEEPAFHVLETADVSREQA